MAKPPSVCTRGDLWLTQKPITQCQESHSAFSSVSPVGLQGPDTVTPATLIIAALPSLDWRTHVYVSANERPAKWL